MPHGAGDRLDQSPGRSRRKTGPVHYQDVFATLYRQLGTDVNTATITDPNGPPQYLLDRREPVRDSVAGMNRSGSSSRQMIAGCGAVFLGGCSFGSSGFCVADGARFTPPGPCPGHSFALPCLPKSRRTGTRPTQKPEFPFILADRQKVILDVF